jgi:hypothetical protein
VKILSEDTKSPIHKEILDKMAALITAAFGLVAALAWNDAIKAVFKEIFGTADAIGPMLGICNYHYNHCSNSNTHSSPCSFKSKIIDETRSLPM